MPGTYDVSSLAEWLIQREPFQVATPVLVVVRVLLAQMLASLLRKTTALHPVTSVVLAIVQQSTFMSTYLLSSYFFSQTLGMLFGQRCRRSQ